MNAGLPGGESHRNRLGLVEARGGARQPASREKGSVGANQRDHDSRVGLLVDPCRIRAARFEIGRQQGGELPLDVRSGRTGPRRLDLEHGQQRHHHRAHRASYVTESDPTR